MNTTKTKPFFSALLDPRVQYIAEPNTWQSSFFSLINRLAAYVGLHQVYPQSLQRKKHYLNLAHAIVPPNASHPMLKIRTTMTFNHVFSFIKHQGHIWYALRKSDQELPEWKLFYIDGLNLSQGEFDRAEMIADGENFMLRVPGDDSDTVYYKKVIDEKRDGEKHIIINLCEEPDAIDSWFTLPILNRLKPKQLGQRLKLAKNAKWAMSNAAEYKYEIIDDRGVKHNHLPITIVYEHHEGLVELHDPYVEKDSTYKVSLPYPSNPNHEIEASASMLFVSSYYEHHGKKQPFLYSHYLDYDSEGLHPLIAVTFDHQDKKKRLLPINQTKVHRLPVALQEINNITALQCSHNPHALEIRVTSKTKPSGFYFKQLDEENWRFYDQQTKTVRENLRHVKTTVNHQSIIYQSRQHFTLNQQQITQTRLINFEPHCTFCTVELTVNGQRKYLILRRHQNLIRSFIGRDAVTWSLNPSPKHPEASILTGKQSISVSVSLSGDKVQLASTDPNHKVNLRLEKIAPHQPALIFSKAKEKPSALLSKNPTFYQTTRHCPQ